MSLTKNIRYNIFPQLIDYDQMGSGVYTPYAMLSGPISYKSDKINTDKFGFRDTVFNNIKYAQPDASEKEIFNAAKLSMSEEFINNLENGYETKIGENGVKLSGGEKQRLSIARAFLKKSKIILLDEATSSLDSETEEKIQKAIEELTKNKTTIVIAHRLSTILNSERIYVIDQGSVESSGKHDELIKNSLLYKNFYERQIKNN